MQDGAIEQQTLERSFTHDIQETNAIIRRLETLEKERKAAMARNPSLQNLADPAAYVQPRRNSFRRFFSNTGSRRGKDRRSTDNGALVSDPDRSRSTSPVPPPHDDPPLASGLHSPGPDSHEHAGGPEDTYAPELATIRPGRARLDLRGTRIESGVAEDYVHDSNIFAQLRGSAKGEQDSDELRLDVNLAGTGTGERVSTPIGTIHLSKAQVRLLGAATCTLLSF